MDFVESCFAFRKILKGCTEGGVNPGMARKDFVAFLVLISKYFSVFTNNDCNAYNYSLKYSNELKIAIMVKMLNMS